MDDEGHPDGGFNAETTINNHGSAPYAGAFFPRSKHFTVLGSTFTSISNHYTSLAVAPGKAPP
ncbi:hypothetical protein FB451DRAFT_1411191 [Mycena latifolia]|nr:hypothetical protein FB451DRAFT_1411191 [Mycena latifolia]